MYIVNVHRHIEMFKVLHNLLAGVYFLILSPQAKLNVVQSIQRFLSKYGFRCINELKLEEHTLHDDPGFVLDAIAGEYIP